MPRTIILPREIETILKGLTTLTEETNGVLLYRRKGDRCAVEASRITGVGSEGHVQARQNEMAILNKFFRQNTEYQLVKFHAHSAGTIRRFGSKYARGFSEGDLVGIKEQIQLDREFIAMLITPETTLLSGLDNPNLEVVERSEDYERNHMIVEQSLRRITAELGLERERVFARRKRQ